MGKVIGAILVLGGGALVLVLAALMFTYRAEGSLSGGAAVLGVALGLLVLLIPIGAGAYLFWQGREEERELADLEQEKLLVSIVKTQGQVSIPDLALEMNTTRDGVKRLLYDLVDKGLFSGYVIWDKAMLYSEQASQLRALASCRNCNGNLTLAGQGVVQCPYCGTEYFLDAPAA